MANKLDSNLVTRAVEALLNHEGQKVAEMESRSLIGSFSKPLVAQVELKTAISKPVMKPVRVKIPYSLFSPGPDQNDDSICLFCKSEDKAKIDEFLLQNTVDGLKSVISINILKKNYAKFDDMKKLLKEHTHFLCDHNIVSQLYSILGKTFLARHSNSPVPIEYKGVKDIPAAIAKSISSTYMHMKGKVLTIKLGTTIMKGKQVSQNVEQGLAFAIAKLHDKWKHVASIHLKLSDSAALPIYTKVQSEAHLFLKREASSYVSVPSPSAIKSAAASQKQKNAAQKATKAPVVQAVPAEVSAATVAVKKIESGSGEVKNDDKRPASTVSSSTASSKSAGGSANSGKSAIVVGKTLGKGPAIKSGAKG